MKRLLITLGAFSMILASCGVEAADNTENSLAAADQVIGIAANEISTAAKAEEPDTDLGCVEEGCIAVFHGGVGEQTYETYVYKDDKGFSYVNVVSTTVSWGSPVCEQKKKSRGSGKSAEEIIKIAENHGADSFVTFPDDSNPHSINEFMDMDFE